MGDVNVVQVIVTAVITAAASGGMNYLSFRGMFGEFKRDIERRVDKAEKGLEEKVSKSECSKEHEEVKSDSAVVGNILTTKVAIPECTKYQQRNDKEHDEIFSRIRSTELGLVAVKKSQLDS